MATKPDDCLLRQMPNNLRYRDGAQSQPDPNHGPSTISPKSSLSSVHPVRMIATSKSRCPTSSHASSFGATADLPRVCRYFQVALSQVIEFSLFAQANCCRVAATSRSRYPRSWVPPCVCSCRSPKDLPLLPGGVVPSHDALVLSRSAGPMPKSGYFQVALSQVMGSSSRACVTTINRGCVSVFRMHPKSWWSPF
jgi:hypothetical protein